MAVFWVEALCRQIITGLMIEAVWKPQTLANSYQSALSYNPEDSHIRTHRQEKLKSHTFHSPKFV
jgi:hypothetical protein